MILRSAMAMLLALALLSPCAASADETPSRALTKQMELNGQRYGIAGQALLVAHNGVVLFRGVDGEADVATHERVSEESVFAAYSVSKLFVSTLVMQLVEQGKVDPDQPASAYLQALPARWQAIRVRDFLDHTSGVPEYFDERQSEATPEAMVFPADQQAVFAALAEQPLRFTPGSDQRYTQTNYVVLAALLAAHYGKPYPQVADERIIRKLDLRHTWLGRPALPARGVTTNHIGKDGRLRRDPPIAWPVYAYSHAELYTSLDDLARFLRAVSSGELVGKATLRRLWQPRTLPKGRAWFASGWEYGESGGYRQVGHDGGARVRVRIAFKDSLDGDVYTFVYLTNGSAKNVWSRTLVDSAMAVAAPDRFPTQALSDRLMGYALQAPSKGDAFAEARYVRSGNTLGDAELERVVNNAGYGIRENLGVEPALRVFELNTVLFPASANAWDSLAETHAAKGDQEKAKALYEKARQLSVPTGAGK